MSEMAQNMGPELGSRGIPWRLVAGISVGALASAGLVYDQASRRRHWPETDETELRMLDPDNLPIEGGHGWLTGQGLGIKDGKEIAEALADSMQSDEPMAYLHFANKGVTIEDIAEKLESYVRPLGSLSINGHSIGTSVTLESLRLLKHEGVDVPPIRNLALNGSPFCLADARLGRLGQIVTAPGYSGGALTKGSYIFARNIIDSVSKSRLNFRQPKELPKELWNVIGEAIDDIGAQATTDVAPGLWVKHFRILPGINLEKHKEDFEGIITPETQVAFFVPAELRHDTTVWLEKSIPRYERFFKDLGIPMETIQTDSTEHANIHAVSPSIGKWAIRSAYEKAA